MQAHKKGIMVDSTHNTTQYKYQLLTVMVLDDFGHGVPVAHFIYKSESEVRMPCLCVCEVQWLYSIYLLSESLRQDPYFVMFDILKTLRPKTRPAQLMTDCNQAAGNAADKVWPG